MKKNKLYVGLAVAVAVLTCCTNQDISFPDFDYQTVYFASQYPIRTVELGEDLFFDNTLDNQHKVCIKATMGGVYANNEDRILHIEEAPSLCTGFKFGGTSTPVTPMPANYYSLASDRITIPAGSLLGGVEVQLSDAFFADPLSVKTTYVIPLLIKSVENADSILRGAPSVANPNRLIDADWTVKPHDFVLYAVKFVNQWHGNYLRRGTDRITGTIDGQTTTETKERKAQYVEQDQVVGITTTALKQCLFNAPLTDPQGDIIDCKLLFTFDDKGAFVVSAAPQASTENPQVTASGTGEFKVDGEKQSMGGKDRDAIYVSYTYNIKGRTAGIKNSSGVFTTPPKDYDLTYTTEDIMVLRDRGVKPEYFTVTQ